tara:strand:+ start:1188 stop:1394 length:207 start_codon:yes stop_codon:yes gene_type:complete
MNTTQKMTSIQLLNEMKGCKVQNDNGDVYTVVSLRMFNGEVSTIGVKDSDGDVLYIPLNYYMEMASVA